MELWDVYDSQGNVTGRVKERGSCFEEGEYHLAASLWIISSEGKTLLQKRSMAKSLHPGLWNITGGAASAGESSVEACIREVAEEIGFSLQPQDIKLLERSFHKDNIFDDYIITRDFDINEAVLQPEEVTELCWFTIEEIRALYAEGKFMFSNISKLDRVESYIKKEEMKWGL